MSYHPVTGLHYYHVVPPTWGAFIDVHASYTDFSSRTSWSSIISPDEFLGLKLGSLYQDERSFFVLWDHMLSAGPIDQRKAIVVPVYSEAIGLSTKMLPSHCDVLDKFRLFSEGYDAIFAHTPWMASTLAAITGRSEAFVLPLGWNPNVSGLPRFDGPKHRDLTFHGSIAGRRRMILPFLTEKLGTRLTMLSGTFGRALLGALDTARGALYVAHSEVESFSTWRIWQVVSTSCALVAEPGDCWPMTDNHYVKIPFVTMENIDDVTRELEHIVRNIPLVEFAKLLHKDLGPEYTVDQCVDRFLVPASETILGKKQS